jgi:hypothetical protein
LTPSGWAISFKCFSEEVSLDQESLDRKKTCRVKNQHAENAEARMHDALQEAE